ncbi:hypothetical protein Pmani_014853 [Petrolisthes manimaculis]|uniref:Uncharacterized protein n=1 Tax=Petrolisthes manimaculis TaxID=1843537 RepID=A0AAE1PUZ6_9EUCA|nr:hypothetical protein Pmani_014853 [Petrolisthes manimaculis]
MARRRLRRDFIIHIPRDEGWSVEPEVVDTGFYELFLDSETIGEATGTYSIGIGHYNMTEAVGRRRKLSLYWWLVLVACTGGLYWWLGSCVLLASVLLSSSSGHMAFSLVMPK